MFWKHKMEQFLGCALIFTIALIPLAVAGLLFGLARLIGSLT